MLTIKETALYGEKYFMEILIPEGVCHEVDPEIPAWGTPSGRIEEHLTQTDMFVSALSWWKAGYDIAIPGFNEWRKELFSRLKKD